MNIKNKLRQMSTKKLALVTIIGFIAVGSGAAQILNVFGTVNGSMNVSQAFKVDGQSNTVSNSYGNVVAGQTKVSNHYASNKLGKPVKVKVDTSSSKGLSVSYRYVDQLVSKTVNNAGITPDTPGDMHSSFAYNNKTGKVGVHSYGQTVYKKGSSNTAAVSSAGLSFNVDNPKFNGSNTLSVSYSVGRNQSSGQTQPNWVQYTVEKNGVKYNVLDPTVNEASGTQFSFQFSGSNGNDFGSKNSFVKRVDGKSTSKKISDLKGGNITKVSLLTGSGSNDQTYENIWYYGVKFNGNQEIKKASGSYKKQFKPGTTDFAVVAHPSIAGKGSMNYSAKFKPVTQ